MAILKRYFLFFLIILFQVLGAEEILIYDNLTVINSPLSPPKNILTGFVPDGSKLLLSTDIKKFGYESVETSTVFDSNLSSDELMTYYEVFLKALDWRILQKEKKDKKVLIIAESQMKKIISVIIDPVEKGAIVKLFLKKQSGY
jgi:hypothetical protein